MENYSTLEIGLPLDAKVLYDHCSGNDHAKRNAAYQQLGNILLRVARSRLRTKPDYYDLAEDCTQKTLAVIYQKLENNQGPEYPKWFLTWSTGILLHKLVDELRKVGKYTLESIDADKDHDKSWILQIPDPNVVIPEVNALSEETRAELLSMMQNHPHLSEDAKFVLIYGFLFDWNDQELADYLGKAKATVRVLRCRGLSMLRKDREFISMLKS
ncbi:MAG: RNA polymerase sigma factor [Caldilineaceae bacterium]